MFVLCREDDREEACYKVKSFALSLVFFVFERYCFLAAFGNEAFSVLSC
jgi:hypothetical protein